MLYERRRHLLALDVVELTAEIADHAARLAVAHPLGGADAVHLASALTLQAAVPVLVTWDGRLATAAASAGIAVTPSDF
jgi:predicted nucleic acid-binding protein